MELFVLPHIARVNRVVPKNAFDTYTNTKQKMLFTDRILRITWLYKLASDTVNLPCSDISEIQVFRVNLKEKEDISSVLDIVDKAIPYHIIFIVEYGGQIYLSTSTKHPHPLNDSTSVIDWTFKTSWFAPEENRYSLQLKKSIDAVYHDFCVQLSGKRELSNSPLKDLVVYCQKVDALQKEIAKLKTTISSTKQFNKKVEFNLKLRELERQLMYVL
jgi:hypothetical protein